MMNQAKRDMGIVGHRGVKALRPENTMCSFEMAVELGLDGIETDVHMTADGQLILIHDALLDRTTDMTGNVEHMRYDDIRKADAGIRFSPEFSGQYVPRLEEFLELAQGIPSFFLNVEMKDYRPEVLEKTVRMLVDKGFEDRFVIACFDASVTTLAHTRYGVKTQGFPLTMVKNPQPDTESHYYAVGISMADLTKELVESYFAKGIDPWCWCPDTEEAVRKALDCGATLMTVNDPRPALKLLRNR